MVNAYLDIAYRGLPSTIEYLHFIYAFGLLVWATSMFASYAVFGHRRPMNAVIVVGVVLVANMALTLNDQLWFLVLYSLASLFLLIRSHVFDEQSEWLRRRIGDPSSISSVYLRGGTIFIGVAVAGSVLLTQTAASAPLAGAFDGVQDCLDRHLTRRVALPADGRSDAGDRPDLRWQHAGPAGLEHRQRDRIDHPPRSDRQGTLLLAGVDLRPDRAEGLEREHQTTVSRPAGSSILDKLPDDPDPTGLHSRSRSRCNPMASVTRRSSRRGRRPKSRRTANLTTVGPGYFATLERDNGGTDAVQSDRPDPGRR